MVMGMLTRLRHRNKINPQEFRTNSCYEFNVQLWRALLPREVTTMRLARNVMIVRRERSR